MHACDDGLLSAELTSVESGGDKERGGIVFKRVAEIGLLGGLGCGGKLVRSAIKHLEEEVREWEVKSFDGEWRVASGERRGRGGLARFKGAC